MDFRNNQGPYAPISLHGTPVEIVSCFRFLGLQISNDLAWTHNMGAMLQKAHQCLYPLWCLRKCGISTHWLMNFYCGTREHSVRWCHCVVWQYHTVTPAQDRKAIQRVVRMAEKIIGCALPSIGEIFRSRCWLTASSIIQDHNHPGHPIVLPLWSGHWFHSIQTRTSRFKNSFYPQAVHLLNFSLLN